LSRDYLYFLSLIAARTAVVYFGSILGLRLLGKRQIGQVNIYDLAMIMALANAVQNAMTSGTGNLTTGIVCAGVLLLLGKAMSGVFVQWPTVERNLCGTPTVLVNDGKVVHPHMVRAGVTDDQLEVALRQHGITDLAQTKMAVLEVDGSLSIVPFETSSPEHSQ
jgi:uncharacterized membrane protein YcaP (DUF421 family)